jgi:hypothetical protein
MEDINWTILMFDRISRSKDTLPSRIWKSSKLVSLWMDQKFNMPFLSFIAV